MGKGDAILKMTRPSRICTAAVEIQHKAGPLWNFRQGPMGPRLRKTLRPHTLTGPLITVTLEGSLRASECPAQPS